ncbi:MAG: hypothetical protein ACXW3Z_14185 [Limisphaerales bacterium]
MSTIFFWARIKGRKTFRMDTSMIPAQTDAVKARMGIALVLMFVCSGCVAIPPLINVQHSEPKEGRDSALKGRVDDLEKRVRELEAKQNRP